VSRKGRAGERTVRAFTNTRTLDPARRRARRFPGHAPERGSGPSGSSLTRRGRAATIGGDGKETGCVYRLRDDDAPGGRGGHARRDRAVLSMSARRRFRGRAGRRPGRHPDRPVSPCQEESGREKREEPGGAFVQGRTSPAPEGTSRDPSCPGAVRDPRCRCGACTERRAPRMRPSLNHRRALGTFETGRRR